MAVFKKLMPNGKNSTNYYYRFMVDGKTFVGSTHTDVKDTIKDGQGNIIKLGAIDVEKQKRSEVHDLLDIKSTDRLFEKRREDLTNGRKLSLPDAFEIYLSKLKASNRRFPSDFHLSNLKSRWSDFLSYLAANYPKCTYLHQITHEMAEHYVGYLREHGRFDKSISFRPAGKHSAITYQSQITKYSNRTVNAYHAACKQIIERIKREANIPSNPFDGLDFLHNNYEDRDIFTDDELALISTHADDFIRPLFIFALNTGYREADICLLKWSEVDLLDGYITHTLFKTGKSPVVPTFPAFQAYLTDLWNKRNGDEYVLPSHADMYLTNRTGVSHRIKQFLENAGIKTTRKVPGRDREVSVKDLHSMRHQFITLAMLHNVPFNVVKSIIGHVSEKMTQRYMDHVNKKARKQFMIEMPNYFGLPVPDSPPRLTSKPSDNNELISVIKSMTAKNLKSKRREALALLEGAL